MYIALHTHTHTHTHTNTHTHTQRLWSQTWFHFWPCYLLVLWSWRSYLTSLSFHFLKWTKITVSAYDCCLLFLWLIEATPHCMTRRGSKSQTNKFESKFKYSISFENCPKGSYVISYFNCSSCPGFPMHVPQFSKVFPKIQTSAIQQMMEMLCNCTGQKSSY